VAQQNQGKRDQNQKTSPDQGQAKQSQRNTQPQTGPWESEKDPEGREKQGAREGGPAKHGGPIGDSDEQSQSGGRQGTESGTHQDGDKGDRSQRNAREGGQSGGNNR
jgi:hypothetical protein